MTADEQLAWMALAELGERDPAPWVSLARELGGARAVFLVSEAELTEHGVTPAGIAALRGAADWERLARERDRCCRLAISLTEFGSQDYPPALTEIRDPPPLLYFRGCRPSAIAPAVAMVGSRRASGYGRRTAERLAAEIACAGVTVISGMAVGIDAAAHAGALSVGRSAAVLAGGLDRPYPRANRRMFDALVERGCVLSEQGPGRAPLPFLFPQRNRIITGLAAAVVVVEATTRSGSLVSARLALEQGRELFAVPGNIDSYTSAGTNALLRDGCGPLLEAGDVLASLGISARSGNPVPEQAVELEDPDATGILALLESEPVHVDALLEAARLDGARVLELLTALELAGLVQRVAGSSYVRVMRG